jgi:hypothetical protein
MYLFQSLHVTTTVSYSKQFLLNHPSHKILTFHELHSHFSYNVISCVIGVEKLKICVNPVSVYHHKLVALLLILSGCTAVLHHVIICDCTSSPPFASKLTVYVPNAHFALSWIFSSIDVEKLKKTDSSFAYTQPWKT